MDLTTDLSGIRRPVNRATHVPGHFYASEDIYALEKEKIFMRDWMLVAREEELEKPGNYLIPTALIIDLKSPNLSFRWSRRHDRLGLVD